MATKITLTYCGMEGEGATVKLAKQDAARKIESALDGYYAPYALIHDGNIGIIARDPKHGWGYRIIWNPQPCNSGSLFLGGTNAADQKDAIAACARHMAQNSGSYVGLERHLSANEMRDLDRYFAWQDAYREARDAGATDEQARMSADMARR